MLDTAKYATTELLRHGGQIKIRALEPHDREAFVAAAGKLSPQSLYRRFFGPKRNFSKAEIAYFTEIDFERHVALVAVAEEGGRDVIVGSGRYITTGPTEAEVAFTVVDAYQGRGIGTFSLLRHLTQVARDNGLKTLVAQVLPDNIGMLKVFAHSGMEIRRKLSQGSVQVVMQLP